MSSSPSSSIFFTICPPYSFSTNTSSPPTGTWPCWAQEKPRSHNLNVIRYRCDAVSKHYSRTQDYSAGVLQDGLPLIHWREDVVDDDDDNDAVDDQQQNNLKIAERVETIRSMLASMADGEITVSPYDTAWVALVEAVDGGRRPQFPECLQWIADNQMEDGSWRGDAEIFSAHDRLINTLGCVVALRTWNLHPDKCQKGIRFLKENIEKLENENPEHMPIGFEVAFPSLLEIAKKLKLDVPYDAPVLQQIYASRNVKLTRIPKEMMQNVATTLLHSLEGMEGLQWEKLLKLQCPDGSFLFSPASTAFALAQTKNHNALSYLTKIVHTFNGGAPNVYPVDLFEHIWAVDRLQRLGISRFFQPQIKQCVDYVYKYWTENGICWARNTVVNDIDDTAMGFRILRLHGYDVSADVFRHFEKGGEFFCFAMQSNQAVTGIFNLFRASQAAFPGEDILLRAKHFSAKFLTQKQAAGQLLDKWIITKDLPGEVGFALQMPWYASLPRIETRFYIEQYGGADDVWIGKTLYRMPYVNNNEYLELAKLDYNNCQAIHRMEWETMQKWYRECKLDETGMSRRELLVAYFVAAASIYEPERSQERLAWAMTSFLVDTISNSVYNDDQEIYNYSRRAGDNNNSSNTHEEIRRRELLYAFENTNGQRVLKPNGGNINGNYGSVGKSLLSGGTKTKRVIGMLTGTINQLSLDALVAHGRDISPALRRAWEKWMRMEEGEREGSGAGAGAGAAAELLVETINLASGRAPLEDLLPPSTFQPLSHLTNTVCSHLARYMKTQKVEESTGGLSAGECATTPEIESGMQQLVEMVFRNSSKEDTTLCDIKHTFFTVARSFYYTAYCDQATINFHIAKMLFQKVE
nr:ent-copalyl diphosphate synthase [Stellera chamaejasme]